MQFTVLQNFDFVGDFLNYTFWTHRQNAFLEDKEKYAFYHSVRYGIYTRLFSKEEILSLMKKANLQKEIADPLIGMINEINCH